jgi:hypothetical protein
MRILLVWFELVGCLMQRALEMFGIAKIGQDFHPKRSVKRRSFDLWITINWRWFMACKFHHIQFSLQICIVLQTYVFQIIFIGLWFVHSRIWDTTKEAFMVDLVKIILANWQLYTWQYVQFAQNAVAHYQSANGLSLKSITESFS